MPAIKSEVEEALHEGIDIQFLTTPVKIISDNGKIATIECIRTKPGDIDASGRRRPIPVKGSEFMLTVDTLILAIGQQPDMSFLNSEIELNVSKWNTLEVNLETLQTNEEGIFAGGDVVTGPGAVTEAIGQGKIAAQMIMKYLQGQAVERTYTVTRPAIRVEAVELSEEELESLRRPQMPVLSPAERLNSFKEVELGFTETQAIQEARRCLRCDLEVDVT
jgi:NADPH-dependent glutamate synthase beta subunit-like oxidoreductase